MSAPAFFTTLSMVLGTVLIIFGMRYRASVLQSQARRAEAEATAAALAQIQSDLADARDRLAAIEKLLKDVG
ncbi:MAG TPA: hypothetical protein PK913_08860 [Phenylobacterium sp.]|jgi:uncharacterized membrane protein|uniref:Phage shock protein B n=1 Tax=Phenylobacterium conjunctum TaxID=1298959 RepID=A0ABW3T0Y8_9CAUL|nr:hypothetical protein [Phenylobacterium sp.]HQP19657.1 hypothetical protein [Phenylobacterium sp.]